MGMVMEYRVASVAEAGVVARMNKMLIEDEGHRNPMTVGELEERMKGWLEREEYIAVLFGGAGAERGYALYREDGENVYLRQFFVGREVRREGVGREAMGWLKEHAWKGKRVRLEVLVGNAGGIAFWRAMGFKEYCVSMEMEAG